MLLVWYLTTLCPAQSIKDPCVFFENAHFELIRLSHRDLLHVQSKGFSSPFCKTIPQMSQHHLLNRMMESPPDLTLPFPCRSAKPLSPRQPPTAALLCPCISTSSRTVATLSPPCPPACSPVQTHSRTLCLHRPHTPLPRSRTAWWSSPQRCPTRPPLTLCGIRPPAISRNPRLTRGACASCSCSSAMGWSI